MLVLSRKVSESIMIGDDVEVCIVSVRGDQVRLGITAPASVTVHRKEVYEAVRAENEAAARSRDSAAELMRSLASASRSHREKKRPTPLKTLTNPDESPTNRANPSRSARRRNTTCR
ncbi:MAG: carbon storage regulator CsrA [Armatimonadota bacterium]